MVDDEELLDLVELEVRELLSQYDFPGRRHPDRAWKRVEGAGSCEDGDDEEKPILDLMKLRWTTTSRCRSGMWTRTS